MNAARILGASFWHADALPRPADDEADHPDRADHPRDRGLQDLRPVYLLTQGGPGRRRRRDDLRSTSSTSRSTSTRRWGYASSVAIIVLIFVSIVGFWAIRPIEQAQEETLEELIGAETPAEAPARAGRGSDRGGGEGLMATVAPAEARKPVAEVPPRLDRPRAASRSGAGLHDPPHRARSSRFPLYWTVTMSFKPLRGVEPARQGVLVAREPDARELQEASSASGSGGARELVRDGERSRSRDRPYLKNSAHRRDGRHAARARRRHLHRLRHRALPSRRADSCRSRSCSYACSRRSRSSSRSSSCSS